jgi:predicted DNA-binding transcriptional regulator YafY
MVLLRERQTSCDNYPHAQGRRVNRTDRLYALVEELRAMAPRPRSAPWLARRFEVSVRTIERDLDALRESGVPLFTEPGRNGGYAIDRSRTLPPLALTAAEALAISVALRESAGSPFAAAAASAAQRHRPGDHRRHRPAARPWPGLHRPGRAADPA